MKLTAEDYQKIFFPTTSHSTPEDSTQIDQFNVPINSKKLIGFFNAAHANDLQKHANDLQKQRSTTGIVFIFMGGAIVYELKTQSITAGCYTESEFIAAHSAAKITRYLRMLLKQLGTNYNLYR